MNTHTSSSSSKKEQYSATVLGLPTAFPSNELKSLVQLLTGVRTSQRLMAAMDIIQFFSPFGAFGRYELVSQRARFSNCYNSKTLSRAIDCLLKAGIIYKAGKRTLQGGGVIYRFKPFDSWGFCPLNNLQ